MQKREKLQVSAIIKIPQGKLERFKHLATELINQTKEKDSGTLKYDWYISSDHTECEVREESVSSEAMIEHIINVREIFNKFLSEFPQDHVKVYGDPTPELLEMTKEMSIKRYSFFKGLE